MSLGNSRNSIGGRNAVFNAGPGASGGSVPVIATNPVATAAAAIVSQTANVTNGTWSNSPTSFTYQLQRSTNGGVSYFDITGSLNSYVFVSSDASFLVRWRIVASNAFGSSLPAFSNAISVLATELDIYPSNIVDAYYLQLLRGAFYTNSCIRVRRSGDNSETNIGFTTTGELNIASLTAFVIAGGGTQNGFIVTWFSQAIGGSNLTQANPSLQAQIVSAGAVITTSGVPTAQFKPNDTYTRAASNLGTAYSIYQNNQYGSTVRHGDITTSQTPTWPINFSTVPVMGWRRETPSLNYLQSIAINTTFSKKAKVRNGFTLTLNIAKVTQYTNSGNFSDTANISFSGWIVPIFGGTEGTTFQRGLLVYSTNHDKATQDAIFDLLN